MELLRNLLIRCQQRFLPHQQHLKEAIRVQYNAQEPPRRVNVASEEPPVQVVDSINIEIG